VEAAYRLAIQTTYPSWGYTIAHGATTIWEIWEYETGGGMNSHNHPMYGTIGSWFYKYLAGITFDPDYPACERVVIKPYFPADLTFVKASLHTVQGEVVSEWQRIGKALSLGVVIPANCTASVSLPVGEAGTVREGDVVIWRADAPGALAPGIRACQLSGDRVEVSVGSGRYSFLTE
jgi:alpha-L-rhamnosidase